MEELLVALACLNGTGCTEVSAEYLRRHTELQEAFQRGETRAKELAGPYAVQVAPVFGIMARLPATVKLSRKSALTIKPKDGLIIWSYQWD